MNFPPTGETVGAWKHAFLISALGQHVFESVSAFMNDRQIF